MFCLGQSNCWRIECMHKQPWVVGLSLPVHWLRPKLKTPI